MAVSSVSLVSGGPGSVNQLQMRRVHAVDVHGQLSFTNTTTRQMASDSESLTVEPSARFCMVHPCEQANTRCLDRLENNQLLSCVCIFSCILSKVSEFP